MAPTLTLKSGTSWPDAWRRCLAVAPEAFRDDRVLLLVRAVTRGPQGERLPGNFPEYQLLP
ncbi:hypothetical protein HDC93_000419 [Streptomyces sp. AK010]|nr:hypothetical protein [Streptomyces sp. AK010]MBB6414867.1 hypothetical protein [Streptomyces sp. AK010]